MPGRECCANAVGDRLLRPGARGAEGARACTRSCPMWRCCADHDEVSVIRAAIEAKIAREGIGGLRHGCGGLRTHASSLKIRDAPHALSEHPQITGHGPADALTPPALAIDRRPSLTRARAGRSLSERSRLPAEGH
jgi:hypothetical protein